MSLDISTASLRALISLTEKREKLAGELSAIEAQISKVLGGAGPHIEKGSVRRGRQTETRRSGKRAKRGSTKERILEALRAAGSAGISVKELSSTLGLKNQNVHVWFNTTGKKLKEIEKTGTGIYRLNEPIPKTEPAPVAKKTAKAKTSRASPPKTLAKSLRLAGKK